MGERLHNASSKVAGAVSRFALRMRCTPEICLRRASKIMQTSEHPTFQNSLVSCVESTAAGSQHAPLRLHPVMPDHPPVPLARQAMLRSRCRLPLLRPMAVPRSLPLLPPAASSRQPRATNRHRGREPALQCTVRHGGSVVSDRRFGAPELLAQPLESMEFHLGGAPAFCERPMLAPAQQAWCRADVPYCDTPAARIPVAQYPFSATSFSPCGI